MKRIKIFFDDLRIDHDDEIAIVVAAADPELQAVVACGSHSPYRAVHTRWLLDALQRPDVDVIVGEDYAPEDPYNSQSYQWDSVLAKTSFDGKIIQNSLRYIRHCLSENMTVFVINSGVTDIAQLLWNLHLERSYLLNHVHSVYMQTGVEVIQNRLVLDGISSNSLFDPIASSMLYQTCMEYSIPMTTVDRTFAHKCAIDLDWYRDLQTVNHIVAEDLLRNQVSGLAYLWERSFMEMGDPRRQLPERCIPQWFINTFIGEGKIAVPERFDDIDIREYLSNPRIMIYDAWNTLFSMDIPEYVHPKFVTFKDATHRIVTEESISEFDVENIIYFVTKRVREVLACDGREESGT